MSLPPIFFPYILGDNVLVAKYLDENGKYQTQYYEGPGQFVEDRYKNSLLSFAGKYSVDFNNKSIVDLVKRVSVSKGRLSLTEGTPTANPALYPSDNPAPTPIRFFWVRHDVNELKQYPGPEKKDLWWDQNGVARFRPAPAPDMTGGPPLPDQQALVNWGFTYIPVLKTNDGVTWRPPAQMWFKDRRWFDLADTAKWYLYPVGGEDPNRLTTPNLGNGKVFKLGAWQNHPYGWPNAAYTGVSDASFTLSHTEKPKASDLVAVIELADSRFVRPYVYTITWEQAMKMQTADGPQIGASNIPDLPAPAPNLPPAKWKPWPVPSGSGIQPVPIPMPKP
ncbi:hypothetical protein H072_11453 [Dactylellina haptotyla CBS 200.50]|uniref:Uncharacterized protein n=1 Tax=Dactylellina haptotyla (strain CBS 200.50) TaxID=1284197 RepID=S8B7U4_DACHA|nr:hypothetical protein H072_11453 [Dactylellina haptotyla CBS 200.50]